MAKHGKAWLKEEQSYFLLFSDIFVGGAIHVVRLAWVA
jgi:hypothetical protein